MLNKKIIAAFVAIILVFWGIFAFATNGTTEKDLIKESEKSNSETTDESKTDKLKQDSDENNDVVNENTNQSNQRQPVVLTSKIKPVLQLIGDAVVNVELGSTYIDAGATATDLEDGSLTNKIIKTFNVDFTKVGTYNVSYDVIDSDGNKANTITRTINIIDTTSPLAIITYGDSNVTSGEVKVILTSNEPIINLDGWEKESDNLYTKLYSENGKYFVEIEDNFSNKNVIYYDVNQIDRVNPKFYGLVDSFWYDKELTYDLSKEENLNNNDFIIIEENIDEIIIDGIKYNYDTAPRTITGEGKHHIKVIDKAGNFKEIVFYIDTKTPDVSLNMNYNTKKDNNYYDNKPITIVVNSNETGLLYSFRNDSNYTDKNTYTAKYTSTNFNIYIKDQAGNITVKTVNLHIDSTPMSITFSTFIKQTNSFIERNGGSFKTLENVYVRANNGWKLNYAKYLWSTKNTGVSKEEILEEGTGFWNNDVISNPKEDGVYYLWAYALDYHGNELLTVSKAFIIDNVVPIITISDYNKKLTNKDIIVTASTNEGSLNKTSYTFTKNGEFIFIATDEAGNKSEKKVIIDNIDKVKPVFTLSGNNPLYIGTLDFTYSPVGGAKAIDDIDGDISNKVTYTTNLKGMYLFDKLIGWHLGEYEVYYSVTDEAGNVSTITRKVIVQLAVF